MPVHAYTHPFNVEGQFCVSTRLCPPPPHLLICIQAFPMTYLHVHVYLYVKSCASYLVVGLFLPILLPVEATQLMYVYLCVRIVGSLRALCGA